MLRCEKTRNHALLANCGLSSTAILQCEIQKKTVSPRSRLEILSEADFGPERALSCWAMQGSLSLAPTGQDRYRRLVQSIASAM